MIWKGKEIKTMGELGSALEKLRTKKEGAEFMRLYEKVTSCARQNVGYVSGYYDSKTMSRIQKLTGTSHPVFGKAVPTIKEAYNAGFTAKLERKKNEQQSAREAKERV